MNYELRAKNEELRAKNQGLFAVSCERQSHQITEIVGTYRIRPKSQQSIVT